MVTLQEKQNAKKTLEALGINPNINLAYFLDLLEKMDRELKEIKSQLNTIQNNQVRISQQIANKR